MKKHNTKVFNYFKLTIYLLLFFSLMMAAKNYKKSYIVYARVSDEEMEIKRNMIDPTFVPAPSPFTKEEQKIRKIVLDVFGKDYEKAMYLLQGKKGTCKENYNLDPKATNVNKDGSTDWGLFQINDKWNGITHKGKAKQLLLDPEINVRVAYRIFVDSGYSFRMWSCGKVLGI